MSKVLVDRDLKGVVWVTLNREYKRNAIDYDVMNELKEVFLEVAENDDDKILVLTGAGDKAFCSGGDLSVFSPLYTEKEAYEMLSKMGEVLYTLFTLPKPTIALLNGITLGGGCEIATACDFRLATYEAKFGFVQGKLSITTGWGGSSILLERISVNHAMKLLLGAKRYTAQEGVEMGFIQELLDGDDLHQACYEWLDREEFLKQNVRVLSAYKQNLVKKWNNSDIYNRMLEEIKQCAKLWESNEHHQAVASFLNQKR